MLRLVCFFTKPKAIIGRSVLATHLGFMTGVKKVVYDGRGAIAAEWKEYKVVEDPSLLSQIETLEMEAILKSRFRIAVSSKLLDHWRLHFGYRGDDHVIIPCTLNKFFEELELNEQQISQSRKKLSLNSEDLVFFYAGSLAGWQSFDLLLNAIRPILFRAKHSKLIFLSDEDDNILKLKVEFPKQVFCKRVSPQQVPQYLVAGDYGFLIREQSITNKVASPVKFAEYLASGMKVIISDNLGDYSEFVTHNKCGIVTVNANLPERLGISERRINRTLALTHFTKSKLASRYQKLIEIIQ